jgi:hypothetical protein
MKVTIYRWSISLRWFEPNTCHYLRKRPMAWGFANLTCGCLGPIDVPLCPCESGCFRLCTDI